jgi:4-hydroxy-tetrahydrodipicolinate reductase
MNIAIIGYGKMGKEIEKIALERGHTVSLKISSKNTHDFTFDNLKNVDVAIEFSNPELALNNINVCIESNTPIVVGTTGWYKNFNEVRNNVLENKGSLLYATNCSIGVNLFFKLNKQLAQIMNQHKEYNVTMEETHHTQKLDAPSGTAITLAEGIINNIDSKDLWVKGDADAKHQLSVAAHRIENVPGTHQVNYSSEIDDIEIKHTAHNRKGFAMGAVIAAEFIKDKKGIFTMEDVLFNS